MKSEPQANPEESPEAIVHQPREAIAPYTEPDYIEASITAIRPSVVESPLTPWGIGAIFVFLIANSLLSWSQWFPSSLPQPALTKATPEKLPPSANLDLSRTNPAPLTLNTLSTVAKPAPNPTNPTPIASVPIAPAQPVINPRPTGSLTDSLLPPSLQPTVMPTHALPTNSLSRSLTATAPPLPPAPKETVSIQDPPRISQNTPPPSAALINERMLEQLRQREEAPANLPFYQREKTRRLAAQTGQDANELMKQLPPQLQQPQTQTRPVQPPQPQQTVPSIIIDRSGNSGNQ